MTVYLHVTCTELTGFFFMSRKLDCFLVELSSETGIVKALNRKAGNLQLMQCCWFLWC